MLCRFVSFAHFFFFNDTATTEIYTLSLHDALPICLDHAEEVYVLRIGPGPPAFDEVGAQFVQLLGDHDLVLGRERDRSEEHTSELQSRSDLVCRLLLEKKNIRLLRRV